MKGWAVLSMVVLGLMALAFMTGPSWCEGSSLEDAPICAGADW